MEVNWDGSNGSDVVNVRVSLLAKSMGFEVLFSSEQLLVRDDGAANPKCMSTTATSVRDLVKLISRECPTWQ